MKNEYCCRHTDGWTSKTNIRGPRGPKKDFSKLSVIVGQDCYISQIKTKRTYSRVDIRTNFMDAHQDSKSNFSTALNSLQQSQILLKILAKNQKKISMTDTKLIPRQSPQKPPTLEIKSNQVIFLDLSNSEVHHVIYHRY